MKSDKEKKMYVWENVLCDYTAGLAVVWATSLKEAREIAVKIWAMVMKKF